MGVFAVGVWAAEHESLRKVVIVDGGIYTENALTMEVSELKDQVAELKRTLARTSAMASVFLW
jgi:hypothetical protein|tara:strand:- start:3058 stop:3246 length:189 start_codon:yes stop_codon:yes gene_type:complete